MPGKGKANLVVRVGGRRITSLPVSLPDSGIVSTEIALPPSLFPGSSRALPGRSPAGWSTLEVRLEDVGDEEPRDDARLFVVEVSPAPAIVMLAAPPDWDTRFLSRTLAEVARVPVKTFVATEPGRWRDAATLAPVSPADLARSTAAARLVVAVGDPTLLPTPGLRRAAPPSLLSWPTVGGVAGDWYVEPPPPSPVAAAVVGIPWDSVPPATAATGVAPGRDTSGEVALSARLARRGAPRPIVRLGVRDGVRQATLSVTGLYRWVFRGGGGGGGAPAPVGGGGAGGGGGGGAAASGGSSRWRRTRMSGAPLRRCCGRTRARPRRGSWGSGCAIAGGCTSWRSPRSRPSGRGGGGRGFPNGWRRPVMSRGRGRGKGGESGARDVGQVLEGRRAQAGRGARAARRSDDGRSPVPRPPPLSRCHAGHAARAGARGRGGDRRGACRQHRGDPHAPRAARIPRDPAGRERARRVRLAGPALPRAHHQAGPAAARHRAGPLLPRAPARAAGVHPARGRGGRRPGPGPRLADLPGHGRPHPPPDPRARAPAPRRPAAARRRPASQNAARDGGRPRSPHRARGRAPAGDARVGGSGTAAPGVRRAVRPKIGRAHV